MIIPFDRAMTPIRSRQEQQGSRPATKLPVSVVVIARNEEENIGRCLESVQWADDLVVVDDHSSDATAERAREHGARVLTHSFKSFARQRNWALDEASLRNEWVLMLDADEAATPELALTLANVLPNAGDDVVAFRMCRKTMFLGQWLKRSDGFPVWIMRLVRRSRARFEDSGHGEVPVPMLDGTVGTIREPFLHYPFSRGINDWVERHMRYAENEAQLELADSAHVRYRDLFSGRSDQRRRALRKLSRRLPARPLLRFLYQFFWKGGILEGEGGFVFSLLMAFYEGLILAKRIELSRRMQGKSI